MGTISKALQFPTSMIEDLPDVPPALVLLISELRTCDSLEEMRRRIKGMLRELRDQSEAFEATSTQRSNGRLARGFDVHLHGSLDLLSGAGCVVPACRFGAADRLARSVGLIADRVWLTDLISDKFIDFGRPTNAKLDAVVTDVIVLSRLMPLIHAGIIKFRSPWIATCASCAAHFDERVNTIAAEMAEEFRSEFTMKRRSDGGYEAYMGNCTDPETYFVSKGSVKRRPSVRSFSKWWASQELRSTMWTAREAAMTGGAVFSNSRIGLAGLLKCDGRNSDMSSLLLLDEQRNLTVPWVSELNPQQIVQLREEAMSALPLLREKLYRAITVSDETVKSRDRASDLIGSLREQAAEVRAELERKRKSSARFWKVTYGILGLGLSAYGVATDQVLPGAAGLLPLVQLLINHKSGHEGDVAKASSAPGYVLVKAQDLLAHADSRITSTHNL